MDDVGGLLGNLEVRTVPAMLLHGCDDGDNGLNQSEPEFIFGMQLTGVDKAPKPLGLVGA